MYENDYVWLLKTMASSSMNLNHLYNLNIKIPEIILLKSGEPKMWFYQEKDEIKTRNENYLKLRLVKEYFADPQAVNDPQMFDFDFMMYSSKQTPSTIDAQKVLFCVTIENPAKEIKIIKKITKRVADELFSNVQENLEFCKQWTKVFTYLPSKKSGLFEVCLTRGFKDEKPKLKIMRRDFSLQDIKLSDFSKQDDRRQDHRLFPKSDKMLSNNNFPSLATTINEVLEKTVKSVARYLEARTELMLGELNLEVVVDSHYNVWIIGSKGIYFYNSDGELDKDTEKENLELRKETLKHFFTCSGSYCKFIGETNFHQEGDEATNLYDTKDSKKRDKPKPKQTFEIPYKSIILDLIERSKHVDRLCSAFTDYDVKQIVRFVETHPFDFRKYYSIGEILQSYLFKGYRVSNMYSNVRVCKNCHFVYEKTDGYRVQNILKPQNRKFNREEAKLALEKYFEKPHPSNDKERKEVFSEEFYKKLGNFDKPILQILGLDKKTKTMEDFFELSASKMRKLSPVTARSQGFYSKSMTVSPQSVKFPVINKEIISDPDNIISRERLTIADKGKAEMIGYKHFLGHAQYLADSGAGYALSKSSIRLNRLQDKLNRFNFVIDNAIEINSFNETENESESQDQMNKKSFDHEDFRPLNHKRIKELQASGNSSDRKSSFHVAVDKIDFFSEKEKAALFEKENRKKEKETQQKKFLASHNLLAQSISSTATPIQKKTSLPQIILTETRSPYDL